MSWIVAMLLLGQVRSGGEFAGETNAGQVSSSRAASAGINDNEASSFPTQIPGASALPHTLTGDQQPPARPSLPSRTIANPHQTSEITAPPVKWHGGQTAKLAANSGAAKESAELQAAAIRLEELLTFDESLQNELRSVRLVEALSRSGDPQSQSMAINDYWKLASAVGRARFAGGKVQLLEATPVPNDAAERTMLDAARTAAEAEESAAQDGLMAAQYRLVQTAAIPWDGKLPWPADLPLVCAYRTNFDSMFAQRSAPLSLRYLNQSLPGKLQLIEKRVAAMSAAESAVDAMLESYKRGGSSLELLLQTIDRLDGARLAFLDAVIDYNDRIAEYSLSAVGGTLAPETMVATLIRVAPANTAIATLPRQSIRNEVLPFERNPREQNPSDVQPASIETSTIQTDSRTLRR